MTVTRSQRIAQQQVFEQAGQLPDDRAAIVHEYGDGWHVVRLETVGDLRRDGLLMRNCLAQYAGDELVSDKRGEIVLGPLMDHEPVPAVACGDLDVVPLRGRHVHARIYSLRDEAGLPHLTWWAKKGSHACSALGYRNAQPKDAYSRRLEQWAEAAEIKTFPTESSYELHLLDVRGDAFGLNMRTVFIEDSTRLMRLRLRMPDTRHGCSMRMVIDRLVTLRMELMKRQEETEAALRFYRERLDGALTVRSAAQTLAADEGTTAEDLALVASLRTVLRSDIPHIRRRLSMLKQSQRIIQRDIDWLMSIAPKKQLREMHRYDRRRGNRRGNRR